MPRVFVFPLNLPFAKQCVVAPTLLSRLSGQVTGGSGGRPGLLANASSAFLATVSPLIEQPLPAQNDSEQPPRTTAKAIAPTTATPTMIPFISNLAVVGPAGGETPTPTDPRQAIRTPGISSRSRARSVSCGRGRFGGLRGSSRVPGRARNQFR